jgi:hypothetical protein
LRAPILIDCIRPFVPQRDGSTGSSHRQ